MSELTPDLRPAHEAGGPAQQSGATWRETLPYVAPFAAFIFFLAIKGHLPFDAGWEYRLRVILVSAVILVFSRQFLSLRGVRTAYSTLIGVAVFLIWIAPDVLFPGYRHHWLFSNSILGAPESSLPHETRVDFWFLLFRTFGSVVLVPILEELFWRGWLMRWLINSDFLSIPFGTYSPRAFWITAVLFASEHGSFWDVGLLAGIIYNLLAIRTRSLSSCIFAHAVTNALLALYVIFARQWQYWL